MTRKTLATYGPSRATVRVFVEEHLVRVQWRDAGRLRTQSWPNTRDNQINARAYAQGVAKSIETRRAGGTPTLTMRDLWRRYTETEWEHLRPNTQRLYGDAWRKWELLVGKLTLAQDASIENLHDFRRELEGRQKLAINTTRMHVRAIKTVFQWGETNELLTRNRLVGFRFKVQKEKRPKPPAQFTPEEFKKILGALDPQKGGQWRAFVAIALCGYQGTRQHAVLHLRWSDVDLEAGRIAWPAEWDKLGKAWAQPLRVGSRAALEQAWRWRARLGYNGPWVLPAPRAQGDAPYDIQSLWWSLRQASQRAGVPWLKGRAGHGFRRMLSKDVHNLTKDTLLALRSIGDTDVRQAATYVQTGDEEMTRTFAELDASDSNETVKQAGKTGPKSL